MNVTKEQIQAAVRMALGPVYEEGLADLPNVADALEEMVEDVPRCLDVVMASPCPCPRGVECPYRGMPPGDAETGHCQQCGEWMPESDPPAKPGDKTRCAACGIEYVAGAPEGEDEPQRSYVAPEDLDANDNGIVDSDLVEEARYRSEQPALDDLDDDG